MADQTDIMLAIKQIAAERKIDVEEILSAIKQAILQGFKHEYDIRETEADILSVDMDPVAGHIAVYAHKTVVKTVEDDRLEISLVDAKKIDPKAKVGGTVKVDITPTGDFGRVAAQSAKQVILQKLRESEKESAIAELHDKMGGIESFRVQRVLPEGDILGEVNRARAIMSKEHRVSNEFYRIGNGVKVLLKEIEEDTRGKFILVSRSDPDFLKALFSLEVPEIDSGTIEIVAIAREAGSRSKVAVVSHSDGVDPIGSCVGQKGVRINAIMNELGLGRVEEKVDIILWDEEIEQFIENSLSPAEVLHVEITDEEEQKVQVTVRNDQYSLAIGREGQNVRLAKKLTGWEIDVLPEDPDTLNAPVGKAAMETEGEESETSEEETEANE